MALDVEAILQTQWQKMLWLDLAIKEALCLLAKLGNAFINQFLVERIVAIHALNLQAGKERRFYYKSLFNSEFGQG